MESLPNLRIYSRGEDDLVSKFVVNIPKFIGFITTSQFCGSFLYKIMSLCG